MAVELSKFIVSAIAGEAIARSSKIDRLGIMGSFHTMRSLTVKAS
jgi:hypothetical protein